MASASVIGQRPNFTKAYCSASADCEKCSFGQGYSLNEFGISPEFDKAEAIKSMEPPKTIKEVQSHLGLFQFFSELIEDYALVVWGQSQVQAIRGEGRNSRRKLFEHGINSSE